jgi:hypothetical protein
MADREFNKERLAELDDSAGTLNRQGACKCGNNVFRVTEEVTCLAEIQDGVLVETVFDWSEIQLAELDPNRSQQLILARSSVEQYRRGAR